MDVTRRTYRFLKAVAVNQIDHGDLISIHIMKISKWECTIKLHISLIKLLILSRPLQCNQYLDCWWTKRRTLSLDKPTPLFNFVFIVAGSAVFLFISFNYRQMPIYEAFFNLDVCVGLINTMYPAYVFHKNRSRMLEIISSLNVKGKSRENSKESQKLWIWFFLFW